MNHRLALALARLKPGKLPKAVGFTLVELLIAVALGTVVIGAAGIGLSAIMRSNARSEELTRHRSELTRALDFISEDIRSAKSVAETSANLDWDRGSDKLGGGSPVAKLYVQVPLVVSNTNDSTGEITVLNHDFSVANEVMFTGDDIDDAGLVEGNVYSVESVPSDDTFTIDQSIDNTSGEIFANQPIVYYIRDNTDTWQGPQTVNRSLGACSTSSNCNMLVDSIAEQGGMQVSISSGQVSVTLKGVLNQGSGGTYSASTKAFARAQ